MPRVSRSRARPMDRPSRLAILLRRSRRLAGPAAVAGACLVLLGAGSWTIHAFAPGHVLSPLRARLTRTAHLEVAHIVVSGRDMTSQASLDAALGARIGDDIIAFSPRAAQARIDALPFVETASVERRLPDTIVVRLVERTPFAVWQDRGNFVLIDRAGNPVAGQGMNGKDAEAFARLPLVVGTGAARNAAALLDLLKATPEVNAHVMAAVRVGDRRWNLSLRNGTTVMLPEGEEAPAIARLAKYETTMALLDRPMAAIDLRLADRMVVRPLPTPPSDPAAAPSTGKAATAHATPASPDTDTARKPA
ncbi:cell division protein FtsQ [Endobacter medicaginis]|uniref:Cell division protein FtsQ n=2 Tax=Endobacter medicaginis TaxID=1181271 RepID=A0A839UZ84_9PROT|nr:cell division protein FtsQ/DivIB [Endobacter medicaginis]MBB3173935.1 cell division protein FtsQ [Endobacter medicaginis]MCX5476960.1 cell division protein FtsQ/DivIB [Endobacter medicaginis]